MPLTQPEIDFIDVFLHEYMLIKRGPAWKAMTGFRLHYRPDYCWLFEAYSNHRKAEGDDEAAFFGRSHATLPPLPWRDAEEVRRRNAELEPEMMAARATQGVK
ncbi:hypothetical protein BH11PLA2_BH11PLA2_38410 [soil metagenome]